MNMRAFNEFEDAISLVQQQNNSEKSSSIRVSYTP